METKEKYFKPHTITLAEQAIMIEMTYPNFCSQITSNGELVVSGIIKPTPLSREYSFKISYVIGKLPRVDITHPNIHGSELKLPHVYEGNNLCLFYPKNKEWTKYDYIADKIIPWISLWLSNYEVWKITGEWMGGGKHPNSSSNKKSIRRHIN